MAMDRFVACPLPPMSMLMNVSGATVDYGTSAVNCWKSICCTGFASRMRLHHLLLQMRLRLPMSTWCHKFDWNLGCCRCSLPLQMPCHTGAVCLWCWCTRCDLCQICPYSAERILDTACEIVCKPNLSGVQAPSGSGSRIHVCL